MSLREQSGGAQRRTRHCRAEPEPHGHAAKQGGVLARGGPSRPQIPEPCAVLGHARWLLERRRLTASGSHGLPLPRACAALASCRDSVSLLRRTA